jgi:hypothetical protein
MVMLLKGTFSQIKANSSKVRREWEKVEDDFILLCMLTLSLDTTLLLGQCPSKSVDICADAHVFLWL